MSVESSFALRVMAIDGRPRRAAERLVTTWLRATDPEPVHRSWGPDLAADVAQYRSERGMAPAPALASYHKRLLS